MKRERHKKWVHNGRVNFLCTLSGNRLLFCGADFSIKVWTLSDVELALIKEIKEYIKAVNQIISLFKERFAL